jgi:hypothetical protein
MTNDMTKYDDLMWDPEGFAHAHNIAKMFAASALIPDHLRGKLADVAIAVLQARRLREDPLILMQNMHVVSGKAGWNASYIIARLNKSGLLRGRVNFRVQGEGAGLVVTAYATDAETGEEVSETVSLKMAADEGWTKNPKYRTMPERMLKYRAATGLMRLHYPEVMLGTSTVEELEDVHAAGNTKQAPRSLAAALGLDQKPAPAIAEDVIDAERDEAPAREREPVRVQHDETMTAE